MHIAVIDHYNSDSSPHKDPITIPRGLARVGHDITLVTRDAFEERELFGFPMQSLKHWLEDDLRDRTPDAVIAITRFDPVMTPVLAIIQGKGIPLIVKGDTDGSLGYPLLPNYLRTRPVLGHPLNLFRQIKWRLPLQRFVMKKIEHIKLADLVVCESPGALANIQRVLEFWKMPEQAAKLAFIPNAVSDDCTACTIVEKSAGKVIAVGRWDDYWSKGSDLMMETVSRTLADFPEASFTIIGRITHNITRRLSRHCIDRVEFTGELTFQAAQNHVAAGQVLLVPSRLESFSLAAGEALCQGCSLAVTPIESLRYLSGDGRYGTVASGFSARAISSALVNELYRWNNGEHDASSTAAHWRSILSVEAVTREWVGALGRLR